VSQITSSTNKIVDNFLIFLPEKKSFRSACARDDETVSLDNSFHMTENA